MNLKTEILKTVLATKQAIKLKRHSINSIILKQEDFKVHMHLLRIIRIFILFNC